MYTATLSSVNDFDEWRDKARTFLAAQIAPEYIYWQLTPDVADMFARNNNPADLPQHPVGKVPPAFLELAKTVICHTSNDRFSLLYTFLYRLIQDRKLLESKSDPVLNQLLGMAKAVNRDSHKMKAFVRFKIIAEGTDDEQFIAWFEPEHYTLERTAPFFARRFAGMKWGIVTPYRSASWDKTSITFSEGGTKADVPDNDALEDAWRTYYASIFNPARLKVSMMKSEMPMKYWKNLPEADLIQNLVRDAKQSEQEMITRAATQPPSRHLIYQKRNPSPNPQSLHDLSNLPALNLALQSCNNCPLAQQATQAVGGTGPANASVIFIGEQPGDEEDLSGTPFVGPAGKIFNTALAHANINRETIYITNAVKHFKFITKAKKRIHQTPNSDEINACNFWLNHELDLIKPKLIVAMGATAAQSLMGKAMKLADIRSQFFVQEDGPLLFITVHPSYLLRIPDPQKAKTELEKFHKDFTEIAAQMSAFSTPALIRN